MMPLPMIRRDRAPWLRFGMVFVACVVLADSLFGERGFAARSRAERHYMLAEQELRAIRMENAGLRRQIRRLQTDPAMIETVAREELGLIRSGELLFVIKPIH